MGGKFWLWLVATLWCTGCTPWVSVIDSEVSSEAEESCVTLRRAGVRVRCAQNTQQGIYQVLVHQSETSTAVRTLLRQNRGSNQSKSSPRTFWRLPTAEETRRAEAAALEQNIHAFLRALPGFRSAAVRVIVPPHPSISRAMAPSPMVSVALNLDSTIGFEDTQLVSLIAGLDARLTPERIQFGLAYDSAPPAEPPFYSLIGPFQVAPESAAPLRVTLLAGLFCLSLASGLLLIVMIRQRNQHQS